MHSLVNYPDPSRKARELCIKGRGIAMNVPAATRSSAGLLYGRPSGLVPGISGSSRGCRPVCGFRHKLRQAQDEFAPWNEFCTQTEQVRRRHLTVDEPDSASNQLIAQAFESDLGSVAFDAEHGFTKEHRAKTNPIQPADQRVAQPSLY